MNPLRFRFPGQQYNHEPKLEKITEQSASLELVPPHSPVIELQTSLTPDDRTKDESVSITSSAKERRNKLRKANNGYESDRGYMSEGGKKQRNFMKGRKAKERDGATLEAGNESDGGYLSENARSLKSSKSRFRSKKRTAATASIVDLASPSSDPGSTAASAHIPPLPDPDPPQESGYLTDSATSQSRRSATKKGKGVKPSRTRSSSPMDGEDSTPVPGTPSKKKLLFRMISKASPSKDKGKYRDKQALSSAPPPVPPMPLSLPIAEMFSRAGTPLGSLSMSNKSASPSPSPTPVLSTVSSTSDVLSGSGLSSTLYNGSSGHSADSESPIFSSSTNSAASLAFSTKLSSGLWNNDVLIPSMDKGKQSTDSQRIGKFLESPLINANDISATQTSKPVMEVSVMPSSFSPVPDKKRKGKKTSSSTERIGSSSSADSMTSGSSVSVKSSKVSTAVISSPNPHLAHELKPPSPLKIVSALQARAVSPSFTQTQVQTQTLPLPVFAPGHLQPRSASPASVPRTPNSFVFVEHEDGSVMQYTQPQVEDRAFEPRQSTLSIDYAVPSPFATSLNSLSPLDTLAPPLTVRRGTSELNLAIAITPTQSQASSSGVEGLPTTPTKRASVLAYYDMPPPSPPPTVPLPRIPDVKSSVSTVESRGRSDSRQFLSPAMQYNTRSPSPLRTSQYNSIRDYPLSRDTSLSRAGGGGLFNQPIPSVRRGKESPFPARPILPPEESKQLVRRASTISRIPRRNTSMIDIEDAFRSRLGYGRGGNMDGDEVGDYEDELLDPRSSAFILAARARGEKRVYFTDRLRARARGEEIGEEHIFDTGDDMNTNVNDMNVDIVVDDDASRYPEDEENADSRSMTGMSVYSRYSIMDPDQSAEVREGFVRRVEEVYGVERGGMKGGGIGRGRGRGRWGDDDIPDVPELPASLRDAVSVSRGTDERRRGGFLKPGSSNNMF